MALAVSTGRSLLSSVVSVASVDDDIEGAVTSASSPNSVRAEDAVTSVSSPNSVRIAPVRP